MNIAFVISHETFFKPLKNLINLCIAKGDAVYLCGNYLKEPKLINSHGESTITIGGIQFPFIPNIVVVSQFYWQSEAEVINDIVSRQLKIRTVCFEYCSAMLPYYSENKPYMANLSVDSYVCSGKLGYENLVKSVKRIDHEPAISRLTISGSPQYDDLYNYKPEKLYNDRRKTIAFLSSNAGMGNDVTHVNYMFNEIVQKLDHSKYRLVLARHPFEFVNMDFIINIRHDKIVQFPEDGNLLDLLNSADMIITPLSTALIPALFYKKPIHTISNTYVDSSLMLDTREFHKLTGIRQLDIFRLTENLFYQVDDYKYSHALDLLLSKREGSFSEMAYRLLQRENSKLALKLVLPSDGLYSGDRS